MGLRINQRLQFSFVSIFTLAILTNCGTSQSSPQNQSPGTVSPPQERLAVALKYVSYTNGQQRPVVSEERAKKIVEEINQIYAPCGIQFRVEDYAAEDPTKYGLEYGPSKMSDLDFIREKFDSPKQLVIINTGNWNREGGLGADGANAWTTLPGRKPAGAVIEYRVSTTSSLIAHELGHYLNLNHTKDRTNLMNPVIYPETLILTPDQCQILREEAQKVQNTAPPEQTRV